MLKLDKIYFSREKPILIDINISIKNGDFFGIVGPSGAGKSTLLKIIAGLLDADKGKVVLNGKIILGPKNKLIAGNSAIQLVNQDFALDVYHTVYENLIVKTGHLKTEIQHNYIVELLDLLELNDLKNKKAIELSGGEQQRLALARALALEPTVLLLDEPFAHLDAHIKRKVISYLLELKKIRKTSLVLVSHDGQELLSLANKIAYFNEGKIQRIANSLDFYYAPTSFNEALFFGDVNRIVFNKTEIIFRPNQYFLIEKPGTIALKVKFIKKLFYGNYVLILVKYKNETITISEIENIDYENLKSIYINY